ncbi:tRNA CCA-pyrophosphorylase [Liquorilactobacillus ghanensis DSM 18630]|uniref:CCA-adding enzyme n=1 Tax=Liquorilactobacillus ghanensis DSM 18630 TaxID=1423750 RepID=A0A0R1VR64_9LACO|nr:CCA tRNA nucleotidyltransferase [Liquorilactobacillus ghanensis]KRM08250.1 tRNA CCA-pyrophosphorylase [Liquorilactobacillus ghanensis DSM 18630]
MRVANLPKIFLQASPVLKKIQQAGFEAYFVGGCVRDLLLGKEPHDVDIATSAYPAEIKQIFKRTIDTGIKHGTVTVLNQHRAYEITTFRTESSYQDFRRPDHVTFVRSLNNDLQRRDLTINALAMDLNGQIIDLFNGLQDLKQGIIRAVGIPHERFHEDALRMMRTVRFASQLSFTIETQTLNAITENAPLLKHIAVERIHEEWQKLLLGSYPQKGLAPLLETKLYCYCPNFAEQKAVLKQLVNLPQLKFNSVAAGWSLFGYLAQLSITEMIKLLRAWKSSNSLIKSTTAAIQATRSVMDNKLDQWQMYSLGWSALQVACENVNLLGKNCSLTAMQQQYQALPIKNVKELAVTGGSLITSLNLKPGPQIGELINNLEKAVVTGRLPNTPERLLQQAQKLVLE